jgi:hypothetical protein
MSDDLDAIRVLSRPETVKGRARNRTGNTKAQPSHQVLAGRSRRAVGVYAVPRKPV